MHFGIPNTGSIVVVLYKDESQPASVNLLNTIKALTAMCVTS